MRKLSKPDHWLMQLDSTLKTLTPSAAKASRSSPATDTPADTHLSDDECRHAAGLMRINHTGEVCAQGLYQGQALTAKLDKVRESMEHAAIEEEDHLAWCRDRLQELNARPSHLNPLFYGMSFTLGALAGAISDKISLGFVAATEDQVCQHLQNHLESLPEGDHRSRAIIQQMLIDEAQHAQQALDAGGMAFPPPVKKLMTAVSKVMTKSTYRI